VRFQQFSEIAKPAVCRTHPNLCWEIRRLKSSVWVLVPTPHRCTDRGAFSTLMPPQTATHSHTHTPCCQSHDHDDVRAIKSWFASRKHRSIRSNNTHTRIYRLPYNSEIEFTKYQASLMIVFWNRTYKNSTSGRRYEIGSLQKLVFAIIERLLIKVDKNKYKIWTKLADLLTIILLLIEMITSATKICKTKSRRRNRPIGGSKLKKQILHKSRRPYHRIGTN